MNFELSEDQKELREALVHFARAELNEGVGERDRERRFPRREWERCGARRLPGMLVPEEFGGLGLDPLTSAVALEALGYGCRDGGLLFALSAHLLGCVVPIWKHGSDEQKERFLPSLCDGSRIAVHAMTEPGSGSDAFAMETRANKEGDGFRLDGVKSFASNAPVADLALVYALTDSEKRALGGITAFLVESGAEGLGVGSAIETVGLRTCAIGELVLDGVWVPATAVVGGVGGGAAIFARSMNWERTLIAASHVGTMERLLEEAIARARGREAFGRRIGEFQAVSHAIADIKVRLEAARLLVYRSAWRLAAGGDPTLDAAMTKLLASESLFETARDTLRILGGQGFAGEGGVERCLRDATGSTVYSGTSEMQRNLIARWLGL